MTTLTPIRNIVFDLGGVLADLDPERCKAAFRNLGMPRAAEWIDPCHPSDLFARMERGDLSAAETCDELRRITGRREVSDEAIAAAYRSLIVGIPRYKLRMVKALREAGYSTYLLSNNNPIAMSYLAERLFTADGLTINDYFVRLYLSYEMHELKPSPAIFRQMLDDSNMEPAETLFIDDGERNIATARALGFRSYQPAPREDFRHLLAGLSVRFPAD